MIYARNVNIILINYFILLNIEIKSILIDYFLYQEEKEMCEKCQEYFSKQNKQYRKRYVKNSQAKVNQDNNISKNNNKSQSEDVRL